MMSLIDLLQGPDPHADRVYGVVTGVVTNNEDPDGLGRVKLRFPWFSDEDESGWARCATPMSGKEMGVYFLPSVDDEVLVAFQHGDVNSPYVIGSLWNMESKPPEKNDDGKNGFRTIKSLSGHVIRLTDTEGSERIEIIDKTAKNSIVIDTKENTITITADADVTIKSANGKLVLSGAGVEISSTADFKVDAKGNAEVKCVNLTLEGSGPTVLKGATVAIN
jgi:uncharacterized protein involved in type VI secretion and phage assembly